jgi:hypothetical protein
VVVSLTLFTICKGQHDELEAKFFEERAALEAKYQKLYEPLYTKVNMLYFDIFCSLYVVIKV